MGKANNLRKASKYASGTKCVYCGKKLLIEQDNIYAKVHTRSFPVCSDRCKENTEKYVKQDSKYKIYLYLLLIVCSIFILIGAFAGEQPLIVFPGLAIGGLGLLLFPYPITSFETFLGTSIKFVTNLTRIIGVIIIVAGIFFAIVLSM